MSAQVIRKGGKPEWAVIPYSEYRRLLEAAEELEDVRGYDRATRDRTEWVPAAVADHLIEGENPVRVWHEHRGLTQTDVAKTSEITPAYLSQIEHGKRAASTSTLKALARALSVDVDDLLD